MHDTFRGWWWFWQVNKVQEVRATATQLGFAVVPWIIRQGDPNVVKLSFLSFVNWEWGSCGAPWGSLSTFAAEEP